MMAPKYFALFFAFLVFSTIKGEETHTRSSENSEEAQPIQRRYSEAVLASDYSTAVNELLKKNFVDWLLGKREKKSGNILDANKRQADFQLPELNMVRETIDDSEGNKDLTWILNHNQINSNGNAALCQQTMDLLMSLDLCKNRYS